MRWRRERFRSERGSVSPMIIVFLPALVGFAGLTYDVGLLFAARRDANTVAAAAARAGANDVTQASLYQSDPTLSTGAPDTARDFAVRSGMDDASARVIADGHAIEVRVETSFDTIFLSILGIDEFEIDAQAQARAVRGVEVEVG